MRRLIMLFLFQGCLRLSFEEWTGFTGQVLNNYSTK